MGILGLMELKDKILLRKWSVIETINDELKNICQVEHSRHRSFDNFITNLITELITYFFFDKNRQSNISQLNQTNWPFFKIELRLLRITVR